jgi:DNA-binding MarR family transcriptional regulator
MDSKRFNRNRGFISEVRLLLKQISSNNAIYEESCVAYFGVTTSQGGAILALPLESTLTMNELSLALGVDNSTMTRMVDQLVERKLLSRKADKKDRRVVRIGLTAAGKKLHEDITNALFNFYQAALEEIQDEELTAILQSLKRLNDSIARGLDNCCKKHCAGNQPSGK